MRKLDDDQLLKILLKEKVIDPEDAQACKDYQKRHFEQRGSNIPLSEVLEKLDILTATRLDSLIRAIESSSVHESIPIFTSTGKVDITKDDKPKIARATLGGMGKSKSLSVRKEIAEQVAEPEPEKEELEEKSKTVSLFAVNQEKVISAKPKGPMKPETRSVITVKEEEHIAEPKKLDSVDSEDPTDVRQVSLVSAYLLLIFLGIFGVHRYYLRKEKSAILYSLTLGFFFVGIIVDFLLMPWLVALARKENRENSLAKIDMLEANNEIPSWSIIQNNMDKLRSFLEFNLQWALVLFIPIILSALALAMAEYWICYILTGGMVLLLVVINENDSLGSSVFNYIPFLSFINNICNRLTALYQQEKPSATILYLVYPLLAPFSMNKKNKKSEFILFSGIFVTVLFVMLIFFLLEINSFPTAESAQNFAYLSLFSKLLGFFATTALLITFITIMVRWRMQSKENMAQGGSLWGTLVALITVLIIFGAIPNEEYSFNHKEKMMLQTRLAQPEFGKILEPLCQSYLKYIIEQPELNDEQKQQKLHHFLGGIVSQKELALFTARYEKISEILTITWIDTPLQALAVINQDRVIDMRWSILQSGMRKSIEKQESTPKNVYLNYIHELLYEKVSKKEGLLKDLYKQ